MAASHAYLCCRDPTGSKDLLDRHWEPALDRAQDVASNQPLLLAPFPVLDSSHPSLSCYLCLLLSLSSAPFSCLCPNTDMKCSGCSFLAGLLA